MPTWNDYYNCLGVNKYSTAAEIHDAYNELLKKYYADEAKLIKIKEAYKILSTKKNYVYYEIPKARGSDAFINNLEQENIFFQTVEAPFELDHYSYFNLLFKLANTDQLRPGQIILDADAQWEKLEYVGHNLKLEINALKEAYPKPDKTIEARIKLLNDNETKLYQVMEILFNRDRKMLYDMYLSQAFNAEMRALEQQIGGRASLETLFKEDPELKIKPGIMALKKAKILNPENFKALLDDVSSLFSLADLLGYMSDSPLVNQENFESLQRLKPNMQLITQGLHPLKPVGLLNQKFFSIILEAGKDAPTIGYNLACFKKFGLLNINTEKIILSKFRNIDISDTIYSMICEGSIELDNSKTLNWQGSPEFQRLRSSIDNMFYYGLDLLRKDPQKAKIPIALALKLKSFLKNFHEQNLETQINEKEKIGKEFLNLLHSKDELMKKHRRYWAVIVFNIFIAATIVGLVAMAINRNIFFAKTQRLKNVSLVEKNFSLDSIVDFRHRSKL